MRIQLIASSLAIILLAFGCIIAFGRILAIGRNMAFGLIVTFGRNLVFCASSCKQAALGVAPTSASEIINAAAFYYLFTASSLHVRSFVREKMMCWWLAHARKNMWWWIASFGESYNDDVLQLAKQLFSVRLLLMTKFFVMRECDNILSGYLCAVTTVFSQQDGIYGFKFPKRFLEISFRDLTLFSTLFSILI